MKAFQVGDFAAWIDTLRGTGQDYKIMGARPPLIVVHDGNIGLECLCKGHSRRHQRKIWLQGQCKLPATNIYIVPAQFSSEGQDGSKSCTDVDGNFFTYTGIHTHTHTHTHTLLVAEPALTFKVLLEASIVFMPSFSMGRVFLLLPVGNFPSHPSHSANILFLLDGSLQAA